jgi:hypothetical protein
LPTRFDAEVQVAGITVSAEDRGPLYAMWTELVPIRQRLQAADIALEEEPSFTQKPAQLGAGITLPGTPPTGAGTPPAGSAKGGPA